MPPPFCKNAALRGGGMKTKLLAGKKFYGGVGERKFFAPSPFNFIFLQRWNRIRINITYILVYGKVFSSSVKLNDL